MRKVKQNPNIRQDKAKRSKGRLKETEQCKINLCTATQGKVEGKIKHVEQKDRGEKNYSKAK